GALILPGDPVASALLLGACGVATLAILFLLHRARDPRELRRPSTVIGWVLPSICATIAIPYFGSFSPAPAVLVFGVYFIGLGRSGGLAAAVYALCAGVQATVSLLVIFEVTRDTGIMKITGLSVRDQLIGQGLVQVVLLATFLIARMSRRATVAAMAELEGAVRVAAHREALLNEAREELQRALRPGRGRFTEQALGAYQLGAVIGRGAMGEVYESVDPRTNARVAIKLLAQASLANTNHVLRFLRELRTAAAIDSPHVVKVLEVGERPVPYLVMERLEGQTLAEILRARRALSPDEVVELIAQVGAGITAAAAAGVVHRDLKPQNLFRHRGTWKILDFGVARAIDSGDTLTAGHVVGTPSYMAPEQASGDPVDHGTDLYALAAIAYRALTGHPPYAAGELAETLYRVVHTRPRRPTELAPHLPAAIDHVLAIGLARRPEDRFRSAAELAAALASALGARLAPELRSRGEALARHGAWATPSHATTLRLRPR
ncbi:MAG TPA: serine/threonine-protein kinase, partial [Kofleriaceae bacterium]|nr:serine/threonine-protein kinase [Kofleriaceae bacterium]